MGENELRFESELEMRKLVAIMESLLPEYKHLLEAQLQGESAIDLSPDASKYLEPLLELLVPTA